MAPQPPFIYPVALLCREQHLLLQKVMHKVCALRPCRTVRGRRSFFSKNNASDKTPHRRKVSLPIRLRRTVLHNLFRTLSSSDNATLLNPILLSAVPSATASLCRNRQSATACKGWQPHRKPQCGGSGIVIKPFLCQCLKMPSA